MEESGVRTAVFAGSPALQTVIQKKKATGVGSAVSPSEGPPIEPTNDLVRLVLEDGAEMVFERCTLAYYSKYFRSLFSSNFADSRLPVIRLRLVHSSDMHNLLAVHQAFERGIRPDVPLQQALNLLTPAAFLQFETVVHYLTGVIQANVQHHNVIMILRYALTRCATLARNIWRILLREFQVLYNTKEFLKLREAELIAALSDKDLVIDAKDEAAVVAEWRKAHPDDSRKLTTFATANFARRPLPDSSSWPVIRNRIPPHVIVAHGGWMSGGSVRMVELFNTRSDRWQLCELGVEEERRSYHGLEVVDGQITFYGGFNGREHYQTTRTFDLGAKTWRQGRNMHEKRCYIASAHIRDSYGAPFIAACGGHNGGERLDSAEMYNLREDVWINIASMRRARSDLATFSLNGVLYCAGGFDGTTMHNDAEFFDAHHNHWVPVSRQMRTRRTGCAGAALTENVAVVVGGFNGNKRLNSVEMVDAREGIWHPLPAMHTGRSNFGITTLLGTSVYVAGGFNGERTTGESERFDIRNRQWQALPDMFEPKSALRLVTVADHPLIGEMLETPDIPIVLDWTS